MAKVIRGVFLKPGVSKNRRLYTSANIARAVQHMQERLSNPDAMPITMHGTHADGWANNTLGTLAKVTKVWQRPDGSGAFEAVPAPTKAGSDMAKLAHPDNGFVKGLSIRGSWMSDPTKVKAPDGEDAITADDLDVMGIDFTHSPGVMGANISDDDDNNMESSPHFDPDLIFESVDEASFVDEAFGEAGNAPGNGKLPYGHVKYADPGYQKDKQKRYPIDTATHVRAAWAYINKPKNAGAYTSAQLARVKSRIKSAARKFNIDITEDAEAIEAYLDYQVDEANKNPYGNVAYADPGYQKDKKKRYPIDTEGHVRAAWSYINKAKNAGEYSSTQLAHIKSRIKSAGKKFNIDFSDGESFEDFPDYESVSEDENGVDAAVLDCLVQMYSDLRSAMSQQSADPDKFTDPSDVQVWAHLEDIKALIQNALVDQAMDVSDDDDEAPFNPMAHEDVNDNDMGPALCVRCAAVLPAGPALFCPTCGSPVPQAESNPTMPIEPAAEAASTNEEATMAESTTEAAAPAPAFTLSKKDMKAIAKQVAKLTAEAVSGPAADETTTTEATPVVPAAAAEESAPQTFTLAQVQEMAAEAARVAVEAAQSSAVADFRSSGGGRKGLVEGASGAAPSRALHEMSRDQLDRETYETFATNPVFHKIFTALDERIGIDTLS